MPELTSGRIKFMNYVTQRKFILLDYLPRGVLVCGIKKYQLNNKHPDIDVSISMVEKIQFMKPISGELYGQMPPNPSLILFLF